MAEHQAELSSDLQPPQLALNRAHQADLSITPHTTVFLPKQFRTRLFFLLVTKCTVFLIFLPFFGLPQKLNVFTPPMTICMDFCTYLDTSTGNKVYQKNNTVFVFYRCTNVF